MALLRLYQAVSTIYPGGYKHNLPSHNVIEEAKKIELDRADFPLEGALSYAVGGYKYVLSGVSTRYGHFIGNYDFKLVHKISLKVYRGLNTKKFLVERKS